MKQVPNSGRDIFVAVKDAVSARNFYWHRISDQIVDEPYSPYNNDRYRYFSWIWACFVVFGIEVQPKEGRDDEIDHRDFVKQRIAEWGSEWFEKTYQPSVLNGELLDIQDVIQQALKFAGGAGL